MEEQKQKQKHLNNSKEKEEEVLPEAHSLPDGFVDGSSSPTPLAAAEHPTNDYKDQLFPQLDSTSTPPSVVILNTANTTTHHKPEEEDPQNQTHRSQTSITATEGTIKAQVANPKEIYPTENTERNKMGETSEVKRKTKRIPEKEFLELTLKYQQVINEKDAAITIRDKLESLCRELQRQNKKLMDECKRVSTEGQNLRLDISSKFHDAIQEISNKLVEQKDECLSQLKENEMLRSNLKQFSDQYALSEKQYEHKLKEKSLELRLADLKIQQYEEKLLQEQIQMKLYADQVSQLLTTEKNLRLQLTADGAKFQQFQDALVKSNEVFETFKQEIEKMTKSIKELRKENTFLKSKCEKSDITLIQLVEEREHLKKQLEKSRNQKEKLESLCRSLQEERKQSVPIVGATSQDSVAT